MTVKIDGTNGLLQSYDYQVLTTGFSYTFAAGTQVLVAVPAGTLATGTITMPSAPADGMVITIQSSQQITALTLNGNTGQSIVGTAVQISPNAPLSWVYRLTNTTWYPFAGEAGRASTVVAGTSVASTSGTSIDFTSIPSWVKRITVMFNGVSVNSTSYIGVRLGTSGGIESTGYVCRAAPCNGTGGTDTTIFLLEANGTAANLFYGNMTITTLGSNIWTYTSAASATSTGNQYIGSGAKTLSGTLTTVRITTTGSDTFDAGSINILYE
jgi:hypothetical protein